MKYPLFYLRTLYGLSYQDIGNVCGVSRQNVMRWENNLLQNKKMILTTDDTTDQELIKSVFDQFLIIQENIDGELSGDLFDLVKDRLYNTKFLNKIIITNELIYRIVFESLLGKSTNIFEDTFCLNVVLSSNKQMSHSLNILNIDKIYKQNKDLRSEYNYYAAKANDYLKDIQDLYKQKDVVDKKISDRIHKTDYRIIKHIGRILEKRGDFLHPTFDEQLESIM